MCVVDDVFCFLRHRTGGRGRERDSGTLQDRQDMKEGRKRAREGTDVQDLTEQAKKMKNSDVELSVGVGCMNGGSQGGKSGQMVVSDFATRQMEKMGHKAGEGLGR
jgi:hypothetical protein